MATDSDPDSSGGLYERRIGTPTTNDEVNGYWLFVFGVLLGLAGVVTVFLLTERATTARGIGYALAALALPFIMLGAVIRFPLRRTGTTLGYLGAVLSFVGVVWFVNIFPGGWFLGGDGLLQGGDPIVIGLYAAGLALIGLAGTVVPLLSDPIHEDYERMQAETTATAAERDSTAAELESTREELAAAQESAATAEERATELEAEADAARAEAASLRESKARFELFEDAGGKPRWRLRHRNGNVIATSGQGYSSRGKAQQGLHSVRRNALGAGLLRIETPVAEAEAVAADDGPEPDDAAEPYVAVPSDDDAVASNATFELFEDDAGEYRWRLRHDNGNIIGDSGEGYASKSNAKRALSRVREHVAAADYLRVDPAAFEVYRDAGGDWRWRLIHENGNVLADSGEGYSSRSKARQGLDSVRANVGDADVDEQ